MSKLRNSKEAQLVLSQVRYGDCKRGLLDSANPRWEITKERPRSLSGVKLDGEKLVRFVYMDESGISVNESILVVAGVVIHADSQWKRVEQYLDELVTTFVPEQHRDGFIFHAKDLFHGAGRVFDRRIYPIEGSHAVLKALLTVPARFRLSVVYGYLRKRTRPELLARFKRKAGRIEAAVNHSFAFSLCAVAAESFMRQNADPGEIATLVAENNTDTRQAVKAAHKILTGKNLKAPADRKIFDFLLDYTPACLPLTKIVDTVYHAEKHEASLLQIADACALIIRYCLEGKASAADFINSFSQGHPERIPVEGATDDNYAGYKVLVFSVPASPIRDGD